jgi:hypothetical protein
MTGDVGKLQHNYDHAQHYKKRISNEPSPRLPEKQKSFEKVQGMNSR